jgi:hypothetical protein
MITKAFLQSELSDLDDSLNPLLEALRETGECSLCHAGQGQQHSAECQTWSFIWSRGVRGAAVKVVESAEWIDEVVAAE